MGRIVSGNTNITQTMLNTPVGGYADVATSGNDYQLVGSVLNKSDYPEFVSLFDIKDFLGEFSSEQKTMSPRNQNAIAYGNGVLVAAGSDGLQYSEDGGNTWVNSNSPTGGFNDVIFAGGQFVAIGYINNCYTSDDGKSWESKSIPQPDSSVSYNSLAYGNGLYIAIPGGYNTSAQSSYATSPDGISWTKRYLPSSKAWSVVEYGGNRFVVLDSGSTAAYSSDGINWAQVTMPVSKPWFDIAHGAGTFVAVAAGPGRPSTDVYLTSPDGITWTKRLFPFSSQWGAIGFMEEASSWTALAYGTHCVTSDDAINWTVRGIISSTADGSSGGYTGIVHIDGYQLFAVTGNSGTTTVGASIEHIPADPTKFSVPGTPGKYVRVK